jgi:hypothetical protein
MFFALLTLAFLAGCSTTAYEKGLKANVDQYRLFSDTQMAQQQTIATCYQFNPNKSECSILAAGTNATQTLAGQPTALRVAKSPGEILEAIATKGFDAAKVIYGIKAVETVFTTQAEAAAAAQASYAASLERISSQGIDAAAKPPIAITVPEGGSAEFLTLD